MASEPLLAGRYRLGAVLGEGAAGQVYAAVDTELGRPVAIKMLQASGALAEETRLLAEGQAMAKIDHPNVARVLDMGKTTEGYFLVLEKLTGGTLERFAQGPRPSDEDILRFAAEVLLGLQAAHAAGVLHRDLKLANVLLDEDGTAKLADFGLAMFSGRQVKTATGMILGTPHFMAPELFDGRPATVASDVYAAGCLIYQICHGQTPRDGDVAELYRLATANFYSPPHAHPYDHALRQALAPDPQERPSPAALLQQLRTTPNEPRGAHQATSVVVSPAKASEHSNYATAARGLWDGKPSVEATISSTTDRSSWGRSMLRPMAAGLLATLVFAALWAQRTPPPPPSFSPLQPLPQEIAEAWVKWVDDRHVDHWMDSVHSPIDREDRAGRIYSKSLYGYRHDGPDWKFLPQVIPWLTTQSQNPLVPPSTVGSVEGLQKLLHPRSLPPTSRRELFERIARLAGAEGYFRAWGLPPPFDLIGSVPGMDWMELEARSSLDKIPPKYSPDTPLLSGTWLLEDPSSRKWNPRLILKSEELEPYNRNFKFNAITDFRGAWDGRSMVHVPKLRWKFIVPGPGWRVTLLLDLVDVFPPAFLQIRTSSGMLDLHPRREAQLSLNPRFKEDVHWRLEVPLRGDLILPGKNRLELRGGTIPGVSIPEGYALGIGRVSLRVESPPEASQPAKP